MIDVACYDMSVVPKTASRMERRREMINFYRISACLLSVCFLIPNVVLAGNNSFYGIKASDISDAEDFVISGYSEGWIDFQYDRERMSESVFAWGRLTDEGYIEVDVTNNSDTPLEVDYYRDKFTLVSRDGTTYYLAKRDINRYYSKDSIAPGETAFFSYRLPSVITDIKEDDVKMVICELGAEDKTILILRPLPLP